MPLIENVLVSHPQISEKRRERINKTTKHREGGVVAGSPTRAPRIFVALISFFFLFPPFSLYLCSYLFLLIRSTSLSFSAGWARVINSPPQQQQQLLRIMIQFHGACRCLASIRDDLIVCSSSNTRRRVSDLRTPPRPALGNDCELRYLWLDWLLLNQCHRAE